nr:EBNA-1 nuclear protein [Candidatus Pantoea persica]
MLIPYPYLLFLGDVTDPLAAKTARGIQVWLPEQCVGEIRLPDCTVSLGLEELDIATAKARGAKTLYSAPPTRAAICRSTGLRA